MFHAAGGSRGLRTCRGIGRTAALAAFTRTGAARTSTTRARTGACGSRSIEAETTRRSIGRGAGFDALGRVCTSSRRRSRSSCSIVGAAAGIGSLRTVTALLTSMLASTCTSTGSSTTVVLSTSTVTTGGVRFTSATTITTPADTTRRLANVGISADSTVLFVLPGPDITNQALTLGNVQVTFLPGENFTVPIDVSITTGPLPSPLPTVSGVSSAAPALLDTVSITAPLPFGFTANSRVTLTCTGGGCVAAPTGFVDVSADHSTLRFVIGGGTGTGGIFTVSNVALGGQASLGVMTLSSTAILTAPSLPSPLPLVAVSNTAPALGDTVTLTAPALFGFTSASRVTLGGGAPNIFVDVSTDGTTLRFVIGPNSTGPLTVNNVKLGGNASLNTVSLSSGVSVVSASAPPLAAVYRQQW